MKNVILKLLICVFPVLSYSQVEVQYPLSYLPKSLETIQEGSTIHFSGFIVLPNYGCNIESITLESDETENTVGLLITLSQDVLNPYPPNEKQIGFQEKYDMPFSVANADDPSLKVRQILVDKYADMPPLQANLFDSISMNTVPETVPAGKAFRLEWSGKFPSTGYQILDQTVVFSDDTYYINMVVDEPSTQDNVKTPFLKQHWSNPVKPGTYNMVCHINGEKIYESNFSVGDYIISPSSLNHFGIRMDVPPIIQENQHVDHKIIGIFPSDEWKVVWSSGRQQSYIKRIELILSELSGIATPGSTQISLSSIGREALLQFQDSIFQRGQINGQEMPPIRVNIGDVPTYHNLEEELIFFNNWSRNNSKWIKLDSNGNFALNPDASHPSVTTFPEREFAETQLGIISTTEIANVIEQFEQKNLLDYPAIIGQENSTTIIENWYTLAYNDIAVLVKGYESAPPALKELIDMMEEVYNAYNQSEQTKIESWQLY